MAIARSAGAAKCVIDVLKKHPGKEDVLVVCCDCLVKLAVDPNNAETIAAEGVMTVYDKQNILNLLLPYIIDDRELRPFWRHSRRTQPSIPKLSREP